MIKVEGHPNLVRDPKSGAVLNINSNEIEAARFRKESRKLQQEKEKQLYNDVDNLKNELSDIKGLLHKLVEKLDG